MIDVLFGQAYFLRFDPKLWDARQPYAPLGTLYVLDKMSGRTDRPFAAIPGICLRAPDGQLVKTPARPIVRDLDTLPDPAWDLVDVENYRRIWMARHGYFSMNIVTTRGCPYHCNWCAKPIYGQRYSIRLKRLLGGSTAPASTSGSSCSLATPGRRWMTFS
jgi:radical SAM superfamily enzyme YgiQ (UPF0313 family)